MALILVFAKTEKTNEESGTRLAIYAPDVRGRQPLLEHTHSFARMPNRDVIIVSSETGIRVLEGQHLETRFTRE